MLKAWILNVMICVSQSFNSIVLLGHPDETLSARCHRNQHVPRWNKWREILNRIYFWQDDHCADSYADDVVRASDVLVAHRRMSAKPIYDEA